MHATDLGALLVGCAALIAIWLGAEYWNAGNGFRFNIYGFNALIAWLAVSLTLSAFFVRPGRRLAFASTLVALSIIVESVAGLWSSFVVAQLAGFAAASWWLGMALWWGTFFGFAIWWIGATAKIMNGLEPERARPRRRAAELWFVQVLALLLLPHNPVFKGRNFEMVGANAWEFAYAYFNSNSHDEAASPVVDTAKVKSAQRALLEAAFKDLAPQRPGVTDVYAIGVAGWSQEDVFIRELKGGLNAIRRTLPIDGRVVRLINHPDTVEDSPLANHRNFTAVVRAVGDMMDKDEDVLLLFLTSHGSREGVALMLPGAVHATLAPADVAAVLDQEGIKNRLVIVSACYAGVFLKPLANDNTIVLTAADENNPSFGCSNEREWTYFGDALFNRSLKPGVDIKVAFEAAQALISQWESNEGKPRSNPLGYFGAAMLKRLAPIYVGPGVAHDPVQPAKRAAAQE